jgi:hypothetical protein
MGDVYDVTRSFLRDAVGKAESFGLGLKKGEGGVEMTLYLSRVKTCVHGGDKEVDAVLKLEGAELWHEDTRGEASLLGDEGLEMEWQMELTEEKGGVGMKKWEEWKTVRMLKGKVGSDCGVILVRAGMKAGSHSVLRRWRAGHIGVKSVSSWLPPSTFLRTGFVRRVVKNSRETYCRELDRAELEVTKVIRNIWRFTTTRKQTRNRTSVVGSNDRTNESTQAKNKM